MTESTNEVNEYANEQFRNMAKRLKWTGTKDELTEKLEMLHKKMLLKKAEATNHEPSTNAPQNPDDLRHHRRDGR